MTASARALSFLVVGEGPLGVAALEMLVAREHRVVAVVTGSVDVRTTATGAGIPVVTFAEARDASVPLAHDVLLNVVNHRRILDAVLSATRMVALNYHDSLLPRHAGFNATTWAILERDRDHGVTWHVLTGPIDSGPVVEQVSFAVEPSDDALALDGRCFEAGVASLATILSRLERGELAAREQDLAGRTFHALQDVPQDAEWIDWRRDAESIARLVRAMQTGSGRARLGPAGAVHDEATLLALDASVVAGRAGAQPGLILDVDDLGVIVAAGVGAVRLRLTVPPTPFECPRPAGVGVGDRLDSPPDGRPPAPRSAEIAVRRVLEHVREVTASRTAAPAGGERETFRLDLPPELVAGIRRAGWRAASALAVAWHCVLDNAGLPVPEIWRRREAEGFACDVEPVEAVRDPGTPVCRVVEAMRFDRGGDAPLRRDALWRDAELRGRVGRRPRWMIATDEAVFEGMPAPPVVAILLAEDGSSRLEFDPTELGRGVLEELADRVRVWLRESLADVERPVGEIECLLPREVELLRGLDRLAEAHEGPLVPELLVEQLREAPGRPAVLASSFELSTAELAERVAAVQAALADRGAVDGATVAVQLTRGPWLVPSVLATLVSGASWLAVDPRHPADRRRRILEEARIAAVLVDGPSDGLDGFPVADVGALCVTPGARPVAYPVDPGSVAYRIFTSGTTGRPKGIEVTHCALANHMRWMLTRFPLAPDDRVLQRASPTFDASVWELLAPPLAGVPMVFATDVEYNDPERLAHLLDTFGVTSLQCAPTLLELLLGVDGFPSRASALRRVYLGGEEARPHDVRALRAALPVEVVNLYGPAEATIDATFHPIPVDADVPDPIPVGRPIDGMAAAVVDALGRRRPPGVAGWLVLRGAGLAAYTDPSQGGGFRVRAGRREYATGDLAVLDARGDLVFGGRSDGQVKVRGHRFELGEVEDALARTPGVRAARVIQDHDRLGGALVAVVRAEAGATEAALRESVARRLPAAAVPAHVVLVDRLPMTAHGKLDRRRIVGLVADGVASAPRPADGDSRSAVRRIVAELLGRPAVADDDNVFDLGGSSVDLVRLKRRVERELGVVAPVAQYFRARTVGEITDLVVSPSAGPPVATRADASARITPTPSSEPIALIGLAGRFPGADSVDELWRALLDGRELLVTTPGEDDPEVPHRVATRVGITRTDVFDREFFGLSAEAAALLDPQQRAFVEVSWLALEDAGVTASSEARGVGVFASSGYTAHLMNGYARGGPRPLLGGSLDDFALLTAADKDFLAPRVSHLLGLEGPSITVQTACSSSLVAVHLAVQSLRASECSVAIAGGASLRTESESSYLFEPGGVASPDGHCRPFSADAQGTVFSSAAAAVVLRPLSEARRRGDHVVAVILGSSVLNDGGRKQAFSAPGLDGHARTIAAAVDAAGVDAATIRYVEAHGTGTVLGDPVEIAAIASGLGRAAPSSGEPCLVGSIKGNIGHTDTVAGVASLIKAAIAVERGVIPATVNVGRVNPRLELRATSLEIARRRRRWTDAVRTAGVSSLGVGGTNAHVVVQSAPPVEHDESGREHLAVVSASTDPALDALVCSTRGLLDEASHADRKRILGSLRTRRTSLAHRAFWLPGGETVRSTVRVPATPRPVVVSFPGQGAHHAAMGAWLYRDSPDYRRAYDEVVATARSIGADDGIPGDALRRRDHVAVHLRMLATQYATARALEAWLGPPAAVVGHSLGEFAAAVVAGYLTLDDAARLVLGRGRGMQAASAGRLLAVHSAESREEPVVPDGVRLAADNSPNDWVLAGSAAALRAVRSDLEAQGLLTRLLPGDRAFHTPGLAGVGARLRELEVAGGSPRSAFVSSSVEVVPDRLGADYWADQVTRPVRFRQALARLAELVPDAIVVECGPGTALSQFARRSGFTAVAGSVVDAEPSERGQRDTALTALGTAWVAGAQVHWPSVPPGRAGPHLPGPAYPFASHPVASRDAGWVGAEGVPSPEPRPGTSILGWKSVDAPTRGADPAVLHHRLRGAGSVGDEVDDIAALLARRSADVVVLDFSAMRGADAADALRLLLACAELVRSTTSAHLLLAAEGGFDVLGDEVVDPVARMLAATVPSLGGAGGFASVAYLDLEPSRPLDLATAAAALESDRSMLAVRGRRLWVPTEQPTALDAPDWDERRHWLVFGGHGVLGASLARHLAERGDIVVAASRRGGPGAGLPPSVLSVSCDVTDATAVDDLLSRHAAAGAPITHVVHAAGATWALAELEPSAWDLDEAERIVHAKITGATALREVVPRHPEVRQVILFSSLSTIEGTPAQAAYAAANGFLDGMATAVDDESIAWLSIGWDTWSAGGRDPGGLAHDVAFAAFDAVVGRRGYVRVRAGRRADARATPTPGREPDVAVPAKLEPTLVGRLQDMVAEVLGTRVPPGESLALHGSDSFAATRIAARIREAFGYGVPLRGLLRADTIAQLATAVEGAGGAPADD